VLYLSFIRDSTKDVQEKKGFVEQLGQVPCARTSLLSGIASGVGFGIIRGVAAGTEVPIIVKINPEMNAFRALGRLQLDHGHFHCRNFRDMVLSIFNLYQ